MREWLRVANFELRNLNFKQVKFCTFIHLINNIVFVLVCAKKSKLITLEQNIISVQQLPLCLPLFFVFFAEVLSSGIKSCFDGVVFQDALCEEFFSILFGVFTLSFLLLFV